LDDGLNAWQDKQQLQLTDVVFNGNYYNSYVSSVFTPFLQAAPNVKKIELVGDFSKYLI
jgi:hypothetical protein